LKVSQLFGLEFYRASDGDGSPFGPATATVDSNGDGVADAGYEVNLSGGGPFVVDMDPGDRVGVIESKTPATEVVNFLKMIIHLALKALDIPFSFFDESFTNFYGSRGGLIQYLISCEQKRKDVQDLLDGWARWRLGLAIFDGDFQLPSGVDFKDLRWAWVPRGVPWWDASKEARGAAMSIAIGASSPQRECRLSGTDFHQNIRETADAIKFAEELGVPLQFADSTAFVPEITTEASE
jgi:capsid protein